MGWTEFVRKTKTKSHFIDPTNVSDITPHKLPHTWLIFQFFCLVASSKQSPMIPDIQLFFVLSNFRNILRIFSVEILAFDSHLKKMLSF